MHRQEHKAMRQKLFLDEYYSSTLPSMILAFPGLIGNNPLHFYS